MVNLKVVHGHHEDDSYIDRMTYQQLKNHRNEGSSSQSWSSCFPCDVNLGRVYRVGVRTLGLIVLYYCFSIGITFYQKWLIKGFHFPLTIVFFHMIIKYMLAGLVRLWCKFLSGKSRTSIAWSTSWKKLAVAGCASSLDIGLSNWSFEFITISLYTMTKSTCVIFILAFAICFGLEKKRLSLVVIVLLISSGLFLFTYKATDFRLEGFILALSASFLGGLRWTLAQLVMQRKDIGLSNPVDMIYYIQPWMICSLIPLVLGVEILPVFSGSETNNAVWSSSSEEFNDDYIMEKVICVIIGALLAFLMELSEYLLLTFTSSLTLSIAGIFKEVFTLFLAFEYNGDPFNPVNFIGLLLCLTGIVLHVAIKVTDVSGSWLISCSFVSFLFLNFFLCAYSSLK